MFVIIGFIVVLASVLGGYLIEGGSLGVILHPLGPEGLMIVGAGAGAFLAGNPPHVIKAVVANIGKPFKGSPYTKPVYMEALMLQYEVYVNVKKGGLLALEQDTNDPHNSAIFKKYPTFLNNHHALDFFCDAMKLLINGSAKIDEIDQVMDLDLDVHHAESAAPGAAVNVMADGFPAFGIVACVMGIVITMGFLDQPPNVIGAKVGAALVGTFLGILLSYGFVQPLATKLEHQVSAEAQYLTCIKAGLLSTYKGLAPAIAVEFARRVLAEEVRPTFEETEQACRAPRQEAAAA
jgi:chemotaxis protein MotA